MSPSTALRENPRRAIVIRRWKPGFQLWLFLWVCVAQALPRNIPKLSYA